jgi:WD40 repeat protein
VATAVIATSYGVEQGRASTRISGLVTSLDAEGRNLRNEQSKLRTALGESSRRMAMLHYERGQTACEQGDIGTGLLYFVASWRAAVEAGDPDAQRLARMSLAAWRPHYPTLKGIVSPPGFLHRLTCGPDGKVVASSTADGAGVTNAPQIWDARSGRPFGQPLRHHAPVREVAFSPNGKTLVTQCSDETWWTWELTTRGPVGPRSRSQADAVACLGVELREWLPSSRIEPSLSRASDSRLGKLATRQSILEQAAVAGFLDAVTLSPDGSTVLTAGARDYGKPEGAQLWDAASAKPIGSPLKHSGLVMSGRFSPDGRTVLTSDSGGDFSARLWDVATTKPLGVALPHRDDVEYMAFSLDGKTILTSSADKFARLWTFSPGQPVGLPLVDARARAGAAFVPGGRHVLTADDDGPVRLWDSATGELLEQALSIRSSGWSGGGTGLVALSHDGTKSFSTTGSTTAQVWSLPTGARIGPEIRHPGPITSVAFSRDGKTVATGGGVRGQPGEACLWDVATGNRLGPVLGSQAMVMCVAFSPDGGALITGGLDRTAQIWDVAAGRRIGSPFSHRNPVYVAAFSPDGKTVLTAGLDNTARLWDRWTGKPKGAVIQHRSGIYSAALSPDGKLVLTGGSPQTARLWDAATGKPIGPWLAHDGPVHQVAFRSDGKAFFTRSNLVRIWQVPELADDLPRASAWVEVVTGMELDIQGNSRLLDSESWHERRSLLESLGGSPELRLEPLRDPILYGPDPCARAKALVERKLWKQAGQAYDEVVAAFPSAASYWFERGRFHRDRGHTEQATSDFAKAVSLGDRDPSHLAGVVANEPVFDRVVGLLPGPSPQLWLARAERLARAGQRQAARAALAHAGDLPESRSDRLDLLLQRRTVLSLLHAWQSAAAVDRRVLDLQPDDPEYRYLLAIHLLLADDLAGYRTACAAALNKFAAKHDAMAAARVAYASIYGPNAEADMPTLIRLAVESRPVTPGERIVGAALYRAGRFDEALEAFHKSELHFHPRAWDWLFRAMIESRLGHAEKAREMLENARRWITAANGKPPGPGNDQWITPLTEPTERLLISRLRGEAESLILYDPIYPVDPFAP